MLFEVKPGARQEQLHCWITLLILGQLKQNLPEVLHPRPRPHTHHLRDVREELGLTRLYLPDKLHHVIH